MARPSKTKPKKRNKTTPRKNPPQALPPFKVLLHNDDVNTLDYVVRTVMELAKLAQQDAETRTREADKSGVSLLLMTHKERAELYEDQFRSKGLTVTIEPG